MKRAILSISPEVLALMLKLPDDVKILKVQQGGDITAHPDTVFAHLEGDGLPDGCDTEPGAAPLPICAWYRDEPVFDRWSI
jgi:hypothetical protein